MKLHVIVTAVMALLLLVLPLPALPQPVVTPPATSNTDSDTESDTSDTPAQTLTGSFSVWDEKNDKVVTMNERDFLFYTVAAEMPVDYGTEALKAQTVASYTYFCYRRERERANPDEALHGADFSDVPDCFPEGYTDEALRKKWGTRYAECHATLSAAVDAVAGKIMTDGTAPILAAYHAISCGSTEDAVNVWESDNPHLLSVPCSGDTLAAGFESVVTLSAAELAAALAEENSVSLSGTADGWLGKATYSKAGTVLTQEIGGHTFTGRQLRQLLGLRSAAFTVKYADNSFTFTVHGYGHGVGMSQYGAGYLARQGMTWEEILHYFYTDVTIV